MTWNRQRILMSFIRQRSSARNRGIVGTNQGTRWGSRARGAEIDIVPHRNTRFSTKPIVAWRSTRSRPLRTGVNSLRSPDLGVLLITHYQRLLNYIIPDYVHVMEAGRIVRSGRKELALELEERGYDWAREEAPEPVLR
jgi:hypothetical protein